MTIHRGVVEEDGLVHVGRREKDSESGGREGWSESGREGGRQCVKVVAP